MNFALGANLALARIGTVIAGIVVPAINESTHNLGIAFGVGFLVCIMSLVNAFGVTIMDYRAEKQDKKLKGDDAETVGISDDDKFQCRDIFKLGLPFWMLAISCNLTYMSCFPYN